jgi:zinc transport system ATP-binding protein
LERSVPPLHVNKKLLVDADNVSVNLGPEAVLSSISLCIHSGEFVGLIGPNGAGKTTLLRVLLGLAYPDKGTVSRLPGAVIGYIPQRVGQQQSQVPMSVLEVVKLGAHGDTAQALHMLATVKMADAAHKRFTELSGGQQQRVAIAKALASNPDMLLLDEPTTGIDEHSQTAFYDTLRTLKEQDITIVMVSHDVDTVLKLVARVVCLNRTVVYDGVPEHFEADKYMPNLYKQQHILLHHHHEGTQHV